MDTKLFVAALNQLSVEKNLPLDVVLEAVKAAIKTAYRKDYGAKEQEYDCDIDLETGLISIFWTRTITEDGACEDPALQITVTDAKKFMKSPEVGGQLRIDVTPAGDYGRIAAQSAKQVILQRLSEAERERLFHIFKEREDELLLAQVSRVEPQLIYLEIDKTSVPFSHEEKIPGEKLHAGQRVKVYLSKVLMTAKGPRLYLSRKHPQLVAKLFEFEIPEMQSKTVEIRSIAREPGIRTKVAVVSHDPKVDPIGACVGQKGVRIQNVIDELHGEMIDVIEWSEEPMKFITQALSPAKISKVVLFETDKVADVYVEAEERPLAIGKKGQNVELASHLTGWVINLHDMSEYEEGKRLEPRYKAQPRAEVAVPVEAEEHIVAEEDTLDILPIDDKVKEKITKAGIISLSMLKQAKVEDLTMIKGITEEKAQYIVALCSRYTLA